MCNLVVGQRKCAGCHRIKQFTAVFFSDDQQSRITQRPVDVDRAVDRRYAIF
jgi:hypothetical protein